MVGAEGTWNIPARTPAVSSVEIRPSPADRVFGNAPASGRDRCASPDPTRGPKARECLTHLCLVSVFLDYSIFNRPPPREMKGRPLLVPRCSRGALSPFASYNKGVSPRDPFAGTVAGAAIAILRRRTAKSSEVTSRVSGNFTYGRLPPIGFLVHGRYAHAKSSASLNAKNWVVKIPDLSPREKERGREG